MAHVIGWGFTVNEAGARSGVDGTSPMLLHDIVAICVNEILVWVDCFSPGNTSVASFNYSKKGERRPHIWPPSQQ